MIQIDDLKPHHDILDVAGLTPDRAFTIAELIVLRVRDERGRTDEEHELLTHVAKLIIDVARAWG